MPYVTPEKRSRLDKDLLGSETAGELGYALARVCDAYIVNRAKKENAGVRYQHLCEVVGTLESLKLDLFREVIAPYEAKVQKENGNVYQAPLWIRPA